MSLITHPARKDAGSPLEIKKTGRGDKLIALAGNPNVGKSTTFNALTGLNQHTGNWPGKTVASASGVHTLDGVDYIIIDLPGTYSLNAHSAEEEITRDFLLFGGADATIVVCDATCLERNLNLALQTMEITPNVIVCVNLMDEARKKGIEINLPALERELGVPVVATSARSGDGLDDLMQTTRAVIEGKIRTQPRKIRYPAFIEEAISGLEPVLTGEIGNIISSRWLAIRLLEGEALPAERLKTRLGFDPAKNKTVEPALASAKESALKAGATLQSLRDTVVRCIVLAAEEISMEAIPNGGCPMRDRDRKLDRLFTGGITGIPVMLALLCGILWLTITGANYPSQLLGNILFRLQDILYGFFLWLGAPVWVCDMLVMGVYRTLAWVVSVMLPPMAIFFPLFTLLEDFGYLPRVAFNLDHQFKKARACGKQALTMCMGFGCNAAGVTGARIIDSPRERLIAILTNNFVPCNGRFPTLIAIIMMFFAGGASGAFNSVTSTLILTGVIVLGVALTFAASRFLSGTILKGEPSSFTLELPPYRVPQIGKVLVRSLLDRTLFVLGRAVAVAAPAGLIIWIFANVTVGGISLLNHTAGLLDPFARILGMDGVILLAFILGFPANEIVVPIIIMAYTAAGTLTETGDLAVLRELLVSNGWTWTTAVSTMLFCLVHWPCSTTCLTVKKETGNFKWTAVSVALPAVTGMAMCFLFTLLMKMIGQIN